MAKDSHHNALPRGYKLHWYVIDSILGRGGFGITYKAQDTNLNRPVAIKEFLPLDLCYRDQTDSVNPLTHEEGDQYKWGLERFIAEAQTLAQFEHPNIVRVIAVFEENNTGYMVMNYEEGEELNEKLKGKATLPEQELVSILLPLLNGIEKVHDAGFIHRDIKPQNIIIRPDGSPKLIDFGSARQALGGKTRTLTSLVTPGYAPFEQYYSKSDKQGPWTDIYAIAATAYRCVVGRVPMNSVDRSEALLHGNPDLFISCESLVGEKYSSHLLKAIDHGLAFKPEERPQSITAWKEEFRKVKRPDRLRYRDENDIPTVDALGNQTRVVQEVQPAAEARRPRSKKLLLVLFVIAVTGVSYVYYRQQSDRMPAVTEQPGAEPATPVEPPVAVEAVAKPESQPQPTAPVTTGVEAQQDVIDTINEHLDLAGQALEDNKLLTPTRDSALHHYTQVLMIDRENAVARTGMQKLVGKLLDRAEKALQAGDLYQAREDINNARALAPNSPRAGLLQERLLARQQEIRQEQARMAAEQQADEAAPSEEELKQQKIDSLLARAEKDFNAMRLTSPKGSNAFEHYQNVLALDATNSEAQLGLQSITEKYIELARKSAKQKNFERGYALLERARSVTPGAESIEFAQNEIALAEQEALETQKQLEQEQAALADGQTTRAVEDDQTLKDEQPVKQAVSHPPGTVFQDTLKDGTKGPEMVVIPAGKFQMGDTSGQGQSEETPVHTVTIGKSFAISKHEIRFPEYERFAHISGRQIPDDKRWGRLTRPVLHVSWYDTVAYVEWLSEQTGHRYRLPSEAEWEYAARAGTQTRYAWGDEVGKNNANCNGCGSQWDYKETAPVGSFQPNRFGVYDMAGNVREWTMDCWNGNYSGAPQDGSAWLAGDCSKRVVRGGAWSNDPELLRSSYRSKSPQTGKYDNQGIRLVRELE